MSVEKNVPEIRFKGFSGDLVNLVLGENSRLNKGQGFSKGDLVKTGTPIILYGRLYTKYQVVISNVDTFVKEKSKSLKSIGGEVIVPASGESPEDIARAAAVNESGVILGGDLNIIYPNKRIDPIYLALALSHGRLKKEISGKAQGKSVVHIKNSDLEDLELLSPNKIEQTQIGNYFQKLDSLINQHQQKYDKLSNIKKSMLEKMFPKQGETIPEIRFKGFSREWAVRGWYDTVDISTNMVDPKDSQYGELYHVGPGNIESFTGKFYNNVLKVKDSNLISGKFHFNKGDLIYGKINPQLAKYVVAPFEGLASADAYVLNTKNGVVQNYLYAILQSEDFYKYTVSVSSRTGMPKINRDELNIYSYMSPQEEEQDKIGNYFQKLDELINQHQQQITKLNNVKQACLNKMFV
jgi:type I restriction enzyme S subunit